MINFNLNFCYCFSVGVVFLYYENIYQLTHRFKGSLTTNNDPYKLNDNESKQIDGKIEIHFYSTFAHTQVTIIEYGIAKNVPLFWPIFGTTKNNRKYIYTIYILAIKIVKNLYFHNLIAIMASNIRVNIIWKKWQYLKTKNWHLT